MDDWRETLRRLGLKQPTRHETIIAKPPEAIDSAEVALLLLKNAVRLLEHSPVPPEVDTHLKAAIAELEQDIAGRSQ